jgi:hypothetical protein
LTRFSVDAFPAQDCREAKSDPVIRFLTRRNVSHGAPSVNLATKNEN